MNTNTSISGMSIPCFLRPNLRDPSVLICLSCSLIGHPLLRLLLDRKVLFRNLYLRYSHVMTGISEDIRILINKEDIIHHFAR